MQRRLQLAHSETQTIADTYGGFVDSVRDGIVSRWAVNPGRPGQKVSLEVRIGNEDIARGLSGGLGWTSPKGAIRAPTPAFHRCTARRG
jgi:hypothetical protein